MAIPNQKLREILFLILFAKMQGMQNEPETIEMVMEQLKVSKSNVMKCLEKSASIQEKSAEIDEILAKTLIAYELDRIQTVEKVALWIGAYEIFHETTIPPKVAIAEALRLTKKFGTPAATSLVNALLDALYKSKLGKTLDADS